MATLSMVLSRPIIRRLMDRMTRIHHRLRYMADRAEAELESVMTSWISNATTRHRLPQRAAKGIGVGCDQSVGENSVAG